MWKAYNRLVGRRSQNLRVFERSPGHDCVVLQHPWESEKEVIEYKVNEVDEAISSRCWRMQALKVPSTFCMHCRVMPTDDFIWFLMRRLGSKGTSKDGTECCCGHCTTQDSDDIGCCIVLQVDYPRQGNYRSVLEALTMDNNVHKEDVASHKVGCRASVLNKAQGATRLKSLLRSGKTDVLEVGSASKW